MTEKSKKNIIVGCWIAFATPFVVIALFLLLVVCFADIPSGEEIENPKRVLVTQVLSEDGKVLTTFQSTENRMLVRYNEISPYAVQAAIATEDARFYKHSGIDFTSLGRVAV